MDSQRYVEDVAVGDVIEPLRIRVSRTQMFFFSAATYNGHRIHYDREWATQVEGHRDVLVHGPLQSALVVRAVTDWIGGGGRLVSYTVRNLASAYPDEELVFTGEVTALRHEEGQELIDLTIQGTKDGEVIMPGTATVVLPRRADGPATAAAGGA